MTSPETPIEAAPGFFIPEHFMREAENIGRRGQIKSVVQRLKLSPEEMRDAWSTSYGQDCLPNGQLDPKTKTLQQYKAACLARLLQLESTHPGGGEMLRKLNGIRSFGRAPIEMLRHLCDERQRPAARAILFAAAVDCPNGAIQNAYTLYEKLRTEVPEDTACVFTEVGTMRDFRLGRTRVQDHGEDVRAHIISLFAHRRGTGVNLRFVSNDEGGYTRRFEKSDVHRFISMMGDVSLPQTTHVLASCSAGDGQDSFAKTLNARSGVEVHAPFEPVYISDLTVADDAGILRPEVSFGHRYAVGDTWEARSSPTRIFPALSPPR